MKKVIFYLSIVIILLSNSLTAQNVTTISDEFLEDGLALDSNGNLYVSHFSGDKVFKISSSGNVSPFVTGLSTPNGLAFDSDDNLYVCDWQANVIIKYNSTGNLLDSYPTDGNPSGIIKHFDNNNMVFTHYSSNIISQLNSDGTITTLSSDPLLNGPVGLAYDENGALFVGNYNNRKIYKVEDNGSLEYIAQLPGSGNLPNLGFIAYSNGSLYGTVLSNHKIYKINPNAVDDFEVFAGSTIGSTDGNISEATFNSPNGLLFNAEGDVLYITEYGSKNLRLISNVLTDFIAIDSQELNLNIIPNPSNNIITISANLPNINKLQLRIYTTLGQQILNSNESFEGSTFSKMIDISKWTKGTYLIQIISGNIATTRKLIR